MGDIAAISSNIYKRALSGSPINPGLPDPLASLIPSMAAHETEGYTSNVFRTDNNAFGYKWIGSKYQERAGVISPEGDNYGHYRDYLDSVNEIIDWIYRRQKEGKFPADLRTIKTPDQFAQLLKTGGYYGDTVEHYATGLKRWPFAVKVAVGGSALLLVLAVIAALNYKRFAK